MKIDVLTEQEEVPKLLSIPINDKRTVKGKGDSGWKEIEAEDETE